MTSVMSTYGAIIYACLIHAYQSLIYIFSHREAKMVKQMLTLIYRFSVFKKLWHIMFLKTTV